MPNALELLIRDAAKILDQEQVAKLWKLPNDLRITGSRELVWGEKGPCDFMGHDRHGRAILIEAKMCSRTSLPVPSKNFAGHQWVALREAHHCNAISLIIWEREGEIMILSYAKAESMKEGRKSIPWSAGLTLPTNRLFEPDKTLRVVVRALINVIELAPKTLHRVPKLSD